MEEQNLNQEQTNLNTQPAEAEVNEGEKEKSVSLGKFKDVQSLLSAYNSLHAEFTKRCQRIKELEGMAKSTDKDTAPMQSAVGSVAKEEFQGITELDKKEIVKGYLKELLSAKQKAVILDGDGFNLKTPVERPKTLEQASILAKEIFN